MPYPSIHFIENGAPFAKAEVASPPDKVTFQFKEHLIGADAASAPCQGPDFVLRRIKALGATHLLTCSSPANEKPRNCRVCGLATALFASLTLSFSLLARKGA